MLSGKSFWKRIEKPIQLLAPMAGYTDSAFRIISKLFGADVVVTELVSADAIAHGKFNVNRKGLQIDGKKRFVYRSLFIQKLAKM